MTDEERLARAGIEKTLAACTQAGDARKADAYARCFTEDGVLNLVAHHVASATHIMEEPEQSRRLSYQSIRPPTSKLGPPPESGRGGACVRPAGTRPGRCDPARCATS